MDSRKSHVRGPGRSTASGWAGRALGIAGAVVLAAGLALVAAGGTATATPGDPHKVWVCHATSSDTNPYVAIFVDVASVKYEGHLEHKNNPNKTWKSDGTFQGADHVDGDAKPDIIFEGLMPEDCADYEEPPNVQPDDIVDPLSGEEMNCDFGARTREGTLTKESVWDDELGDWVLEAEADWETLWGEWSDYRELTTDEIAELGCVLGEETIIPSPDKKPEKTRTPTVLGTQAAVPSAVAAGATTQAQSSPTGLAALALLGGLTLLSSAGLMMARTRRSGSHEA